MKAIRVHTFGGPEVLTYEEAPDPNVAEGSLLVRMCAVGVNPVDTYVRQGTYGVNPPMPYIPGTEAAGEVVEGRMAGQRVAFLGTDAMRMTGCYAELASVRRHDIIPLPDHLSYAQGAAIPVAYATAWRALFDRASTRAGDVVLVHGASGGVGIAATQIAVAHGATVIGTAGTAEGIQLVRQMGAKLVLNHREPGYLSKVKEFTNGSGADVILEMIANVNLDHDLDVLAPGGRVVVIGSRGRVEIDPRKTMGREAWITGVSLWAGGEKALTRAFAGITAGLVNKTLIPTIDTELPLSQAAIAHDLIMQDGTRGKVVLIP